MPRYDTDRNAFVARIDRRRRWSGWAARMLRGLGMLNRPSQEFTYRYAFSSDVEALSYAYALKNDHLPDLENPVWFNEKIRWQFINHLNPLMSLVADKIAVRDYLCYRGGAIKAPELIAFSDRPADLALVDLPRQFALKSAYGSGQNHIETLTKNTPRPALIAKAAAWMDYDQWRSTGEFHYRDLPKRWLVEEFVPSRRGQIEYKLFCMMGEPVFFLVVKDREDSKDSGRYKRNLYDLDWKRVDFHWRGNPQDDKDVPRPEMFDQMVADARKYAKDFLNVRVDFLQCDDRMVFSELTFASAAARIPFEPIEANVALGDLIDLSQAGAYLEHGIRIAAELNWPDCALTRKV